MQTQPLLLDYLAKQIEDGLPISEVGATATDMSASASNNTSIVEWRNRTPTTPASGTTAVMPMGALKLQLGHTKGGFRRQTWSEKGTVTDELGDYVDSSDYCTVVVSITYPKGVTAQTERESYNIYVDNALQRILTARGNSEVEATSFEGTLN